MDATELLKDRLKHMRKAEGLTQPDIAELSGIPLGTWRNMEQLGSASFAQISLLLKAERFRRYALWLMTGEAAPSVRQISPEIMMKIRASKEEEAKAAGATYDKKAEILNSDVARYCEGFPATETVKFQAAEITQNVSNYMMELLNSRGIR
jgi:transcriptional regulator with XRE-family HTH domain